LKGDFLDVTVVPGKKVILGSGSSPMVLLISLKKPSRQANTPSAGHVTFASYGHIFMTRQKRNNQENKD
jgi:hypothetical protein